MQEVIIGKEGTQKFPINNSRVSRQHAKITVSDSGQWTLEDLNSTNGTYINGKRMPTGQVLSLPSGSVIMLANEDTTIQVTF